MPPLTNTITIYLSASNSSKCDKSTDSEVAINVTIDSTCSGAKDIVDESNATSIAKDNGDIIVEDADSIGSTRSINTQDTETKHSRYVANGYESPINSSDDEASKY